MIEQLRQMKELHDTQAWYVEYMTKVWDSFKNEKTIIKTIQVMENLSESQQQQVYNLAQYLSTNENNE